jgi:acetyl esterase
MGLHPQAEAYIEWMTKEHIPAIPTLSPTDARLWDAKVTALMTKTTEPIDRVEEMRIPRGDTDVPVRMYAQKMQHPADILLYFHGGGWVLGNLEQVDYPCRLLAKETERIVVSVGYRLAPENKFPAPLEDCYGVTKWVAENAHKLGANDENLAVCGDSAGGNLAAGVCLVAEDRGGPSIQNQILIYPVTDLLDSSYQDFPNDQSPGLTRDDMVWFIKHYVSKEGDLKDEYAAPILRADLRGQPPALLITAEYDILTKQCNAYANRLKRAQVQVHSVNYPGLIHGFFTLPDVFDAAKDAMKQIAEELKS